LREIRKILVANRGEIALRVMRTAHALGKRSVAVFSEADAHAPHVTFASEALPIGAAALSASYLNIEAIVAAAKRSGADAVHPGYGLLSENAKFARACVEAGLVFIGPRPDAIELMGDKRRARVAVQAAGVPCVPGYDGEDQADATLVREAARVGFPLMVKARAGGGGRGMRRVDSANELSDALARARSEAKQAFGDDALILERVIENARHVELQVFGDEHGQVIHLGERDCSAQRRFQKILEESPSPAVEPALRARMGEVAVQAARSASYVGAGTVEFLLGPDGAFYFLEMNTRLQVEHPVTECVTGFDLVEWQIRIAQGEPLPVKQQDIALRGHAIEARLYAEDPARGFLPGAGTIRLLHVPSGEGVRVDHGLAQGLVVSPHYDPMLAKIIAHGATRELARQRLLRALDELRVLGLPTNRTFLRDVLAHPSFVRAEITTAAIEASVVRELPAPAAPTRDVLVAAALICVARSQVANRVAVTPELQGFTSTLGVAWPISLEHDAHTFSLLVSPERARNRFVVLVQGETVRAELLDHTAYASVLAIDGLRRRIDHASDGTQLWLQAPEGAFSFRDVTYAEKESVEQGNGRALAPMDGAVIDVPVQVGQKVSRGDTLAIVSAMKLELRVCADIDGTVREIHSSRGDQVKAKKLLVVVAADGGGPAITP
jgi:geranyl-CoA carboxylase alpha subunit